MSKVSKEELMRLSGANWALQKVKEIGIEATEKELKMRGATGLPLAFSPKDKAECEKRMRKTICTGTNMIWARILQDKQHMKKAGIDKYLNYFNDLCDSLLKQYLSWEDLVESLKEEVDIYFDDEKEFLGN